MLELLGGGGSWAFHLIDDLSGQGPGPSDRLLRDSAGNLYGTTWGDGAYGNGNVFRLTPNGSGWTYTSLHDFTGGADGGNAFGGLVIDSHGNIFGTTYLGGSQSCGFAVWSSRSSERESAWRGSSPGHDQDRAMVIVILLTSQRKPVPEEAKEH